MNDLEQRLRDEARNLRMVADPELAERIVAALPVGMTQARRPTIRWPVMLAAAATLLIAVGVLALSREPARAISPVPAVRAVPMPVAPDLEELLVPARTAMSGSAMPGEIAALQSDLAVIIRTVRGAVPF